MTLCGKNLKLNYFQRVSLIHLKFQTIKIETLTVKNLVTNLFLTHHKDELNKKIIS